MSRYGYFGWLIILAILAGLSPPALTPAQAASWQSRGLGGGGALFCPAISPHDNNLVYMATDMSSVFKSGDFGRSWTTLDFRQLQGGPKSNLRFTADPNILYAINLNGDPSTDNMMPSRSLDGGNTWTPLPGDPTGNEAYFLFADPNSTNRLLVSDYNRLYFSNNSGTSFSEVYHATTTPPDGLRVGGVFWDGANIYVGTSAGLIVSTNGGTSFTVSPVGGIPADEVIVSFSGATQDGSVRFLAVTADINSVWSDVMPPDLVWSYKGVYRLDWGSGGWVKKVSGLPGCAAPAFVAMALNNINVAYVAGENLCDSFPMICKTTNGGDSWTDVFLTTNNQNIATGWSGYEGDRNWWYGEVAMDFAVCPNNANRAIITDFGFAHVTDDGGATWRQAYVQEAFQNPAGFPTPQGKNYAGNGVEDTSVWWLDWFNADTLFASFTDIQGIRSTDKGRTWVSGTFLGLPYNTTYYSLKHPGSGLVYAATSERHDMYQSYVLSDDVIDDEAGNVIFSGDNGQTWQTLHDFGHPVIWLALHPTQANTMYASVIHSTAGGIYVTHNLSAGASSTWTKLGIPPRTQGHPLCIRVLNDGALVASYSGRRDANGDFTDSSGVFLSTDGGASWQDRSDPNMHYWTKDVIIDPHDATQNTWYVAVFSHWGSPPYDAGGLYRTTDRGQNWTRINSLFRVESATVHPRNSNVLYLTTEIQGLWLTQNLRQTSPSFTQVSDYPFRHPTRVLFNPYNLNETWVASFGGGLLIQSGSAGRSLAPLSLLLLN
jgi:photosystem II stability/assembly factor-like uncharacterized protein